MVGGFHASDGFSVLMEPPSQIILPDTNQPILYNETSHLLVFLYFYLIMASYTFAYTRPLSDRL